MSVGDRAFAWSMVLATILLTSYGQLVLKWQTSIHVPSTLRVAAGWPSVLQLLLRPWVLSAFIAAFAASLCWMLALARLELSRAYPFMAFNFVIVSLAAAPLFGEAITGTKLAGLILVVVGLAVLSQG